MVRRFVDAINGHDVARILTKVTEDHVLVDPMGMQVQGASDLRIAWRAYFELFPDYRIEVSNLLQLGDTVGIFGTARGTYAVDGKLSTRHRWQIPAAWRAVVRRDGVAVWQVFADNEPVRKIMAGVRGV